MSNLNLKQQILTLSFVLLFTQQTAAHEINTSYSIVEIQGVQLTYTLTLDQTEIDKIIDLDENGDRVVSGDELLASLDRIYTHFEKKVTVIFAGDPLELERGQGNVAEDGLGNVFVNLTFKKKLQYQPWKLTIQLSIFDDLGPQHKNLAKIINGEEIQQAIFTVDGPRQVFLFEGGSSSPFAHASQFLKLGVEHIVIGYDHILFLMGLIIIGGSFWNLVKIVTSFTVAHSVTLILAALQIVTIPSRLVESVIALSIVYIALENFFIKKSDERWLITFIFGLMHGFGFAGVLRELGLPSEGLAVSLLSFNVGVEIGQFVIIALTFPLIYHITKTRWRKQLVYGLSSVIMTFGLLWFIERAFELDLPII